MKGPHFFEKRKKEMARQEKAKQKAERKAQRKSGKERGQDGEASEATEVGDAPEGATATGDLDRGTDLPAEAASSFPSTETEDGDSAGHAPRDAVGVEDRDP